MNKDEKLEALSQARACLEGSTGYERLAMLFDEGVFTVYSLPSMNKLFSLKASCYSLNPAGGRFYGNDREHFVLVDGNGNELLSYEIDYTKVNGI